MGGNKDVNVYRDKKTKAEDFKSSAYTLLIVGILGLAALAMMEFGILPIKLAAPGKYITYAVMGIMFIVFIIMGISSFRSAKTYEDEARDEDDLTARIKEWANKNISADDIKSRIYFEDNTPEEMKYFRYFEVMKELVVQEFGDMNISYLDAVCEELYSEIFEK